MSYPDDVGEEDGLGIPDLSRLSWVPGAYVRLGRGKTARPKTRGRAGMRRGGCSWMGGGWSAMRAGSLALPFAQQAGSPYSVKGWKPVLSVPHPLRLPPRALRLRVSLHSLPAGAEQARRPFSNTAGTAMLHFLFSFASSSAHSAPQRFFSFACRSFLRCPRHDLHESRFFSLRVAALPHRIRP